MKALEFKLAEEKINGHFLYVYGLPIHLGNFMIGVGLTLVIVGFVY